VFAFSDFRFFSAFQFLKWFSVGCSVFRFLSGFKFLSVLPRFSILQWLSVGFSVCVFPSIPQRHLQSPFPCRLPRARPNYIVIIYKYTLLPSPLSVYQRIELSKDAKSRARYNGRLSSHAICWRCGAGLIWCVWAAVVATCAVVKGLLSSPPLSPLLLLSLSCCCHCTLPPLSDASSTTYRITTLNPLAAFFEFLIRLFVTISAARLSILASIKSEVVFVLDRDEKAGYNKVDLWGWGWSERGRGSGDKRLRSVLPFP
jgi:hypothetical protein